MAVMNRMSPGNVPISPIVRSTKMTGTRITWVGMNMPAMKKNSSTRESSFGVRASTYAAGAHTAMARAFTQSTSAMVTP